MKRTSCSACGSSDLNQFLDLGMSPVADAYTAAPDEVSPTYPLQVAVCAKCHLVQLLEVLSGAELFGTGYAFRSSASAPLQRYHEEYAAMVLERHRDLLDIGVVEIGCNDGDLLKHFVGLRHRLGPVGVLGVDPSLAGQEAADRGLPVAVEPFGLAAAQWIRLEGGPQGVVIANHVLAHVEDVSDTLAGIAHLLDDGVAIIEVQYLPDLLVNNAFDLVYHEHRNFFSLTSLEHAAQRHGLYVIDAEVTDRQGGSLRATLAKTGGAMWQDSAVTDIRAAEGWLDDFSAYAGMQGRAERIRTRLLELLDKQDGVTAVYGAPAKVTTLLNFCGLTAKDLPWCVDTTPAKQGRHIPGTGIPIYAPGEVMGASTHLLGAHNYARDIMRRHHPDRQWILPFPAPVLL